MISKTAAAKTETPRKGMSLSILGDTRLGNCSANGISARYTSVTVTGVAAAEGYDDPWTAAAVARGNRALEDMRIFAPKPQGQPYASAEVFLVVRRLQNAIYIHAEPVGDGEGGGWAMAGGCFIETCDSRWSKLLRDMYAEGSGRQVGPIPLHDRYER